LECVRIPSVLQTGYTTASESKPLDNLGFPLITGSDAHYVEHVGRRPFELDITMEALLPAGPNGGVDMEALKQALGKRPRG
jgi:histidinol phosphatase-like PHP family hydrolase